MYGLKGSVQALDVIMCSEPGWPWRTSKYQSILEKKRHSTTLDNMPSDKSSLPLLICYHVFIVEAINPLPLTIQVTAFVLSQNFVLKRAPALKRIPGLQ